MNSTFWSLLKESVIVTGLLALGITGGIIYLSIMQLPVPDILAQLAYLVIGYFVGQRTQAIVEQQARSKWKAGEQ